MVCQAASPDGGDPFGPDGLDPEGDLHLGLLATPPGETWSGRTRYAAAMYFHAHGQMNVATLEVFRILSRLDDEDPLPALTRMDGDPRWRQIIADRRAADQRASAPCVVVS